MERIILPRRGRAITLAVILVAAAMLNVMWGTYGAWVGWAAGAAFAMYAGAMILVALHPERAAIVVTDDTVRRRHPVLLDRVALRRDIAQIHTRGLHPLKVVEVTPAPGSRPPQGARRLLSIPPFLYGMSAAALAAEML